MRVLVATKEKQGIRKSDFCFTNEGELVRFGFECDRDKNKIDGGCGCRRSMAGFDSKKATTTFKVVEKDMNDYEFNKAFLKTMEEAGWLTADTVDAKFFKKEAEELIRIANIFPVNQILEKRGNKIKER